MKTDLQIKLINWIANDATEEQLEGLVELLFDGDIFYGLEKLCDKEQFQEFLKEIRED